MNSFNNIEKIRYTQNQQDVVTVKEYIVFDDERAKEKYILLKLVNNLNQRLHEIKLEVSQFDIDANLVEKTTVSYKDFIAKFNETFVPNAKLRVNYACKSIQVKLIFARFDRVKWEHEAFVEIDNKFSDYKKTLPTNIYYVKPDTNPAPAKKKLKRTFKQRQTIKQNYAKFPKFWNGMTCVLTVGFVALTAWYFTKTSDTYSIDGIDYKQGSGKTVYVSGYDGTTDKLIIPSVVNDMKVTRILEGAFKKANFKEVTFKSEEISIESNAFVDCENLQKVTGLEEVSVRDYSFVNCPNIAEINLPNATLFQGSFSGSTGVQRLVFDDCETQRLADVFSIPEATEITMYAVTSNMDYFNCHFLEQIRVSNFYIPEDAGVEYGIYSRIDIENLVDNGTLETINGEVVTVNANTEELVISSDIKTFDSSKFKKELSNKRKITVKAVTDELKGEINNSFFKPFNNLTTLEFSYDSLDVAPWVEGSAARTLIAPGTIDLSSISFDQDIIELQLLGNRVNALGYSPYVETIKVDKNCNDIESSAFTGCYRLRTLSMPAVGILLKEYVGSSVQSLEILYNGSMDHIPSSYFTSLSSLRTVEVEDGFTQAGSFIFDSSNNNISDVKLPSTLTSVELPLIGEGCVNLRKLDLGLRESSIHYIDLNRSYANTRELAIRNVNGFDKEFFNTIGEERLNVSKIAVCGENINPIGLFSYLPYLTSIELDSDSVGTYVSDLFMEESHVNNNGLIPNIETFVISTPTLSDNYFTSVSTIRNIYLQEVTTVSELAFEAISNVEKVYVPATITAYSFLQDFPGATIYFEGEAPEDKSNYRENVSFESIYQF